MNQTVPPPPGAPAPKKGMSTLVKVLLGCGVLVLLGIGSCFVVTGYFVKKGVGKLESFAKDMESNPDAAAVKAAELVLRLNPEVEVLKSDPEAGTITVREKKSGKEVTFTLEDIKAGKFRVKSGDDEAAIDIDADSDSAQMKVVTKDGSARFGTGQSTPDWIPTYPGSRTEGIAAIEANGEKSGSFTVRTSDSVDSLLAYFQQKFEGMGFEVSRAALNFNGAPSGTLTASSAQRNVNITATAQEGETQALVSYSDKP